MRLHILYGVFAILRATALEFLFDFCVMCLRLNVERKAEKTLARLKRERHFFSWLALNDASFHTEITSNKLILRQSEQEEVLANQRALMSQSVRSSSRMLDERGSKVRAHSLAVRRPPKNDKYKEGDLAHGLGTPTPSEKVSRWHRDIFLVRGSSSNEHQQQVHPRQCLCNQCMAELGTFKFYNERLTNGASDKKGNQNLSRKASHSKAVSKLRIFIINFKLL